MKSDSGSTIPNSAGSRSSFFRNRLSNASLLSLSSLRTLLPQYDAVQDPSDTVSDDTHAYPHPSPTFDAPVEPPRYSLLNPLSSTRDITATHLNIDDDTQQFRYSYPIRSRKAWATLRLLTRDAVPGNPKPLQRQPRLPRFWSCDPIKGALELDLDSPQDIQHINILLTGSVVTSSHSEGCLQILAHELTLWDKSMGDPLQPPDANDTLKKKFDGRFVPGKYNFPFSFPIPTHANPITKSSMPNAASVSPFPPSTSGNTERLMPSPTDEHISRSVEKKKRISWTSRFTSSSSSTSPYSNINTSDRSPISTTFPRTRLASPLPQSFTEKGLNPSVAYEISVCIVHGRFRASSRIKTNIAYFPASQPPPASQKRREAYEMGASLPSPMDDPEGWSAWPTHTIYGVVNADGGLRHTKAECTLYLAQPLAYTRGSVIPCFLTIFSNDEQVVHLLSNPKTPTVRLLRRIRHPMGDTVKPTPDTWALVNTSWTHINMLSTGEMELISHEVGRAQWWIPSKNVAQGPNVIHFEGEIHLNLSLQPSCSLEFFRVEYVVELLPFQTDEFEPEIHPSALGKGKLRERDIILASNPVEITTLFREDEPIPMVYSEPPKISTMRRVDSDDKNPPIFEED